MIGLRGRDTSQATVVCYNFTGDLGAHTDPWLTSFTAGFPPSELAQWQDFNATTVSVVNRVATPALSEAMYVDGANANWRVDLSSGGAAPTYVAFNMWVYAGAVSVDAYNSSGTKIWGNTYSSTALHPVSISPGSGASYLLIKDGNNETWIDNFCMD